MGGQALTRLPRENVASPPCKCSEQVEQARGWEALVRTDFCLEQEPGLGALVRSLAA